MSKSVNKVFLLGHVGKDPEIKATQSGNMVVNFSLATTDRVKDQGGSWNDRTEWHNLVAFKRTAEIIRDYVHKGSKVYIEGKVVTRSWDDKDTGKKAYRTEIIVNDVSLLDSRSDQTNGNSKQGNNGDAHSHSPAGGGQRDDYGDLGIDDSEIPF